MSDKAVVLHSGGLDSTVCLLEARSQGYNPISLGIDYDQRLNIEMIYAKKQCEYFDIPRRVISVEWDKPNRDIPLDRNVEEIGDDVSTAFLPGRNVVFLSLACAEAAGVGAETVWIGVNAVDFSGYPDCRPSFVESFREMISEGYNDPPDIVTPLLEMSKPEIASKASQLGIERDDTWSCYNPHITDKGISSCGRCDACTLHRYAWDNA